MTNAAAQHTSARLFLVVEDDALVAQAVSRRLHGYGTVCVVDRIEAARTLYRHGALHALLVDVMLPDGSGVDFVEEVRSADTTTPILIMTGLADRDLANQAHRLRASFVHKPFRDDDIALFAERAVARATRAVTLAQVGAELATRHRLTRSEATVLGLTLDGYDVPECAEALHVQECTVRAHRASILHKTRFGTMAALLQTALRRAAESEGHPVRVRSESGVRPAGLGYADEPPRPRGR
ncbi:MAG: response regulator [Myxococcales bacterium]|nr:response regulator [Myxococcales bacterium]